MADRMAAYLDQCRQMVAEHGWVVQGVFPTADAPGFHFAYTAGLCVAGLPELVVVGLPPDPATLFLNALARRALGEEPTVGARWTVEVNRDLTWTFAPVADGWAKENISLPRRLFPDVEVRVLQVLWPDKTGVFPNEPGWALGGAQPLLAEERRG